MLTLSLIIILHGLNLSLASASESIQEIRFITEHNPPFNYVEDKKIKGIFVEVLTAVAKQMDSSLPWDRVVAMPSSAKAYQSMSEGGKKCLFGVGRTEENESQFKWVGPVIRNRIVLIAKTGSDIRINSISRIRSMKTGVVKEGLAEKMLLDADLPLECLFYTSGDQADSELLQHLESGMIDLWAFGELNARWVIKKNSLNPRHLKSVFVVKEEELYFAFGKDVSNGFISVFQRALDRVKNKGAVKKIMKTYISDELTGSLPQGL